MHTVSSPTETKTIEQLQCIVIIMLYCSLPADLPDKVGCDDQIPDTASASCCTAF